MGDPIGWHRLVIGEVWLYVVVRTPVTVFRRCGVIVGGTSQVGLMSCGGDVGNTCEVGGMMYI